MSWTRDGKEKGVVILISLSLVLIIAAILYFQPPFFNQWIIKLENDTYDRQVRRYHRSLPEPPSIAIVNIDDPSLAEEGRWPWDRTKIAKLTRELERLGASVVAFDMVFSELQENPVDAVLKAVNNPSLSKELDALKPSLDANQVLADAFKKGKNILGFAFSSKTKELGILPAPLLTLSLTSAQKSLIPEMSSYIGNQPLFQQAAGHAGFINTMIDSDGILRFSPLLMRENEKVYPALALQAAQIFLDVPFRGIKASASRGHQVIQAIQLGDFSIPTDPWGRILVPFRGPPFSFPYLSASDLLHGRVDAEKVRGKLIFIGITATASSDLIATAISPVFPGVEVQATIASGIIDHYLPYKPDWGRGVAIGLVVVLGVIAAFTFPFMSRIAAFLFSLGIILALEFINYWIWTRHELILSFFFPMPTLITIFVLDLISIYISDKRQNQEIKRIFGQYVPPDYLDQIIQKKGEFILAGETKELSILFASIWDFPSIAKPLSAAQLKQLLNLYFTKINEVIYEKKGIIDKYVRDEIIAFWGAPLAEPNHPFIAVQTALNLQAIPMNHKIGIGINTGPMHVGDMGSKLHRSYTAIGEAVDLAERLKNLTQTYSVGILVGYATWKLTHEKFAYRKIDRLEEEIFEPVCLKEQLTPSLAAELEAHEEALEAYLNQDWAKSKALFQKLKASYPQQSLYPFYLQQIASKGF